MKRWIPVAGLALVVGCEVKVPAPAVDVSPLKSELAAATKERDELKAKLARIGEASEAVSKSADRMADAAVREQKLAIGRYLLKVQILRAQVGLGGAPEALQPKYMSWLTVLRNGEKLPSKQYLEMDRAFAISNGAIPDEWFANIDWSDDPRQKALQDSLSTEVFRESASDYAARLKAAKASDAKAMLVFEREMERIGELSNNIIQEQ